jgi:hypothetical protein
MLMSDQYSRTAVQTVDQHGGTVTPIEPENSNRTVPLQIANTKQHNALAEIRPKM